VEFQVLTRLVFLLEVFGMIITKPTPHGHSARLQSSLMWLLTLGRVLQEL
jgi:hypothetical protein